MPHWPVPEPAPPPVNAIWASFEKNFLCTSLGSWCPGASHRFACKKLFVVLLIWYDWLIDWLIKFFFLGVSFWCKLTVKSKTKSPFPLEKTIVLTHEAITVLLYYSLFSICTVRLYSNPTNARLSRPIKGSKPKLNLTHTQSKYPSYIINSEKFKTYQWKQPMSFISLLLIY